MRFSRGFLNSKALLVELKAMSLVDFFFFVSRAMAET
jgi:hypothetical protein